MPPSAKIRNKCSEDKGELHLVRLLPNVVTIIGLSLGMFAIKFSMNQQWQIAITLIAIAAFLDGVDGRLARLLNASSNLGAHLDSFADFVNFGVAPALIIYLWKGYEIKGIGWAISLFFIISMALRLARFNASMGQEDEDNPEIRDKFFQGMPAPCSGLMVLLPIILTFMLEEKVGYVSFEITALMVVLYTAFIAILTVSSIPTPSIKTIKIPRRLASLFMALFAMLLLSLIMETWVTLSLIALIYISTLPIGIWRYFTILDKKK